MFKLLKKEYVINTLWKTYSVEQLSYYDCLEFYHKILQNGFDVREWCYEEILKKIQIDKKDLEKIDINKFFKFYIDYACKWFFWVKQNTSNSESIATFSSFLCFLSEKIHLHPLWILKEYTPEQLEEISEGIIFNLNEQTKEWRTKNKVKHLQKQNKWSKEQNEADLKYIQEKRELYKKKILSNNK